MSKKGGISELAKQEKKLAYLLLLPTALILLSIAFYPLGQVFVKSFTNDRFASSQPTEFVGLQNYKTLLSVTVRKLPEGKTAMEVLPEDPRWYKELAKVNLFGNQFVIGATDPNFINAIINTLIFTVCSVFFETLLGMIIALVVNSDFKGRGGMRAVMLIPWSVITVVSATMWEAMLQSNRIGLFNTVFEKLGIGDGNIAFLTMEELQLPSLIAIDVWKTTPFMALLILAGLQLIPNELYEAAEVDGASKVNQFFNITLPLIKPSLAIALVFRTLNSLRVFDIFQVLLETKRYSMASYNYYQLIQNRNMGLASSIGVLIFILIAAFAAMYIRMLGVDMDE